MNQTRTFYKTLSANFKENRVSKIILSLQAWSPGPPIFKNDIQGLKQVS